LSLAMDIRRSEQHRHPSTSCQPVESTVGCSVSGSSAARSPARSSRNPKTQTRSDSSS
jgi:hypothetical protein